MQRRDLKKCSYTKNLTNVALLCTASLQAGKVRRDELLLDKAREILARWHQTASL